MELLAPIIVGVVLSLFTAIQTWISRGRFDTLERSFDALQRRFDAHEQSSERRFEQLLAEIAQLRSDLLQVALASRPPQTQTG